MIRNQSRFLLFASCAAVALLAAPPASAQDLLVGQVASQTNPATAANAKGMVTGLKTYLDFVNERGGIGGRQVKLVTKDDNLVPGKMVEMTKEYIADKNVLALAGYVNTGGITEVSKANLPGQAGIAMIAPLQGDKSIVGAENFFPFRSGYPDEVIALVKEAANTQKKKVVVVYWNITFGPAMMKLVQEMSKQENLKVVAWVPIDATAQDKFEPIMKEAVAAVVKESPDTVIMLISGRYSLEFIKQMKNSTAADAQLYAMSIVPSADVVKAVGEEKARGIVIAQAVPFPFSATLPLVSEYQKLMKQYAPNEPLSFSTLEGFVAGKITVEAIKRAGPKPTREKVLKALYAMGEVDLGGVYVNYSSKARNGWGLVDLTVIGPAGKLLR
ncbi:MAG TPA: ABC transporter substrate-binding protein [Burkholderiales bacterium]|nr:ABC transporter substrate-binding protein [Burkholderiales bacterium]